MSVKIVGPAGAAASDAAARMADLSAGGGLAVQGSAADLDDAPEGLSFVDSASVPANYPGQLSTDDAVVFTLSSSGGSSWRQQLLFTAGGFWAAREFFSGSWHGWTVWDFPWSDDTSAIAGLATNVVISPSTLAAVLAYKGYYTAEAGTTSIAGLLQLATSAESTTGTNTTKATTPADVKDAIDARGYYTAANATSSAAGLVQLATTTETVTGTNATKATTPADVKAALDTRVVVGPTNTLGSNPGIWVQTDGSGNVVTFWIENGL